MDHVLRQIVPVGLRLGADDGDFGFQVGRLDVGDQAGSETAPEAVFQFFDVLGELVAGDDDLLAGVKQLIKGVEKLLLRGGLPGDELDVVDEEDVDGSVAASEPRGGLGLDRGLSDNLRSGSDRSKPCTWRHEQRPRFRYPGTCH